MDLDELVRPILDLLHRADDRDARITDLAGPDAHEDAFARLGVPLSLGPGDEPLDLAALTRAIEATIARSVRTLHPRFFNQNFAGADPIAVIGDFLGAALNTTLATYEAAPVFTLMERAVLARLAALAGWPAHEGLFVPGGSFSNLHALQLARLRVDPEARERGHDGAPLVAFTSAHAHYSLKKAVVLLGLGRRALVEVACDERGQMRPEALAAAIDASRARGERPFFVNATAGTTVLGGFDPLPALADLAERHDLWLHVDGSFGASALFSVAQAHRMEGVARADSLAWNLHKMLGVTQQCAAFLVQKTGTLRAAFATGAEYLFQPDKPHADLDSGDLTFQCARRVDALKAWLTWKARGEAGFAARIDHAVALADHAAARIAGDRRFLLAAPPSWVNVCFWWIPPDLRPLAARTPEVDATLHALAPRIKAAMLRGGAAMLGFQPIDGGPNCFRLLFINPATRREDVDATLDILDACGREALA
ncbi:pyridoxal phosphate-dependent decarboxylase family protein [Nannocystis radixulma]|uniref:Pyridoxal-dependent decarboxylase n=1 Tax=Nannocystis radixulma TaxID=2995305 RepID=A0ABT5BH33_9BACT|nr:pyridoxal-dependent decarboxylase [Nannocystis radixulma]MDC0673460.1 pyridoxal-dependent decarboxylase [Nannocystis radixulma]